jgi:hypothetical protein
MKTFRQRAITNLLLAVLALIPTRVRSSRRKASSLLPHGTGRQPGEQCNQIARIHALGNRSKTDYIRKKDRRPTGFRAHHIVYTAAAAESER